MADDKKNANPELPDPKSVASPPAWFRLVDQLNWYNRGGSPIKCLPIWAGDGKCSAISNVG
jgi:hypothetical protein